MSKQKQPSTVKTKTITFLSGSAGLSLLPMLVHAPLPASIGGLIVAGFLAHNSPQIAASIKESLPFSLPMEEDEQEQETFVQNVTPQQQGELTKWDKFLGKKVHSGTSPSHEQPKQDKETLPVTSGKVTDVEDDEDIESVPCLFPAYPEDETLRLGKVVATGQRFDPSIDALLGMGAIFAGSQGSGKSNAVSVIAEHVGKCYMSEIIFDMKREYHTILGVVPNGIHAAHPDAEQELGAGSRFYALTLDNAAQFAYDVMSKGYQAVFDIPSYLSYGNDWNYVAQLITAIINSLMKWSIAQKDAKNRLPCLLSFDEAHIFFPQQAEMKQLFTTDTLSKLNVAAFNIVNMGRSYGYTMLFSTQRIANIAKWTIGNCQIKVIMRHSVDVDLERCEEEVGKDVATRKDIKTIAKGEGYVLGFTPDPLLVHFDMRQSRHDSHTPDIARSHARFRDGGMQASQRPMVEQRVQRPYAPLPQRRDESDVQPVTPIRSYIVPTQQEREVTQPLQRQTETTGHFTSVLTKEQQTALRLYRNGMTYRELAALMTQSGVEIGKDKAGELIKLLKAKKLIA